MHQRRGDDPDPSGAAPRAELLLLGAEHAAYGVIARRVQAEARTAGALSVGADRSSPSLVHKGDPTIPNEDAALAIDDGRRTLLAVSDAHFGHQASHVLLTRLAARCRTIPENPLQLLALLQSCGEPGDRAVTAAPSAATLVAAVLDRGTRHVYGASFGDSTLALVSERSGTHILTQKAPRFVTPDNPTTLEPRVAQEVSVAAQPGDLVVVFTDGVDECHYGRPETSVQPEHLTDLARHTGLDPAAFVDAVVDLALQGVAGHPGGQDNIAVVATRA
ncbi:MAG: SpoIIE family protein phosphatase [Planctomycetota bacterium]